MRHGHVTSLETRPLCVGVRGMTDSHSSPVPVRSSEPVPVQSAGCRSACDLRERHADGAPRTPWLVRSRGSLSEGGRWADEAIPRSRPARSYPYAGLPRKLVRLACNRGDPPSHWCPQQRSTIHMHETLCRRRRAPVGIERAIRFGAAPCVLLGGVQRLLGKPQLSAAMTAHGGR